MGQKLNGFRSAPSGIEFGPGLYARQDYAVGDVITELSLDRKKLEEAMVGDGWSNSAVVSGAVVATVGIKKGDEIVVTTNLDLV